MKNTYSTLDDHLTLLREKGFTEQALNLKAASGLIEKVFRLAIGERKYKIVYPGDDNIEQSKYTQDFALRFRGRFDNGADKVVFKLHFRYNAEEDNLNIRYVTADMGRGISKNELIVFSDRLPHSKTIYNDLCAIRAQKVLEMIQQRSVSQSKSQSL
jgi:hypothetical protein